MFKSFFPSPKAFFLSILIWSTFCITCWYLFRENIGASLGFDLSPQEPVIGIGHFYTDSFQLFSAYYLFSISIFALFWFKIKPHKWQYWSIIGSAFIMFSTYFSVQVSVALNNWRRPFFDLVQAALDADSKNSVTAKQLYDLIYTFAEIALLAVFVYVMTRFIVNHYIFRWRTAMNDYYTKHWEQVRQIEGASQRVQEDTMIFARIVESLGVSIIDSIMTLFAFLPILWGLSSYVTELPIIGDIPYPLFNAVLFWSLFGTILLVVVGIKLPGLEFKNQRVEAAYRKELVYGEDSEDRAEPLTLKELFNNVRKNYFKLYFHYLYFNVARSLYLNADNIFTYFIMIPTIVAGKVTFGLLQQILTAFSQVSNSFQYLVNSWPTIVELLSVRKRLKSFEAAINDEPLPEIDRETMR